MDVPDRPMDAAELARWTRFAAKGGIGRGTALTDFVAERVDDLMFLKNDEIVVLLQLPEENMFLGYCEGIVGRFHANDVHFLSKLKKPVMTKRSSVGGNNSGKSTPTPSLGQSPSPSLLQGSSPRSGTSYQPSISPQPQLRYQPPPSPPLTPSSSREHIPRSTSHSSTTVSVGSTSTSLSSSTLSSSSGPSPETPMTLHSSPEPIQGWPKPLETSASMSSVDTNVSGRSSTYIASMASANALNNENDDEIVDRHNRRSETTMVEMWPSSPTSTTIARKPVNGSRLALAMHPPAESEESDVEGPEDRVNSSESDREPEEYPDDGGWALRHGGTLPLQVVKLNSPNPGSIPPSPYRQGFPSSPLAQTTHDHIESDSRPDSVNQDGSTRSSDSASNYDTTESEDNADETARFSKPPTRSPSPSPEHHRTVSVSDSVKSQTRSRNSSITRDGSILYGDTSTSLITDDPTRSSIAAPSFHGSEDGEVGIGLSLLGGLLGGDDDASDSDSDDGPSMAIASEKDPTRRQSAVSGKSATSAMRGPHPPGEDWDGESIYENYYRFSRSTNARASTSTFASAKMPARFSHSSQRGMPITDAEIVPPVPVDPRSEPPIDPSRPGIIRNEKTRSIDSDASVYTQASKTSSVDPSRLSARPPPTSRRPAPLELTGINGEPSPLLHTRWGSPASSASPPTSSAAGQSSFFEGTPPASASSGSISPGGAASQLRQRLEIDRASPIGTYTKLDESVGEGLGGGIVVEDDEELPAPSITSEPRTESPEGSDVDADVENTELGPDTLTPLVIADSVPDDVSASLQTPTTTPSSPPDLSPPPAQAVPPPQHQTRPSLSELRGYAANDSPSPRVMDKPPGQRTSMFLPHPNAPKPPPPTGAPEGPLYIRQPPLVPQQRSDSAQDVVNIINMSIGRSHVTRVMPTIYGRTELDLRSATGPVKMVFSIDPLPPLSAPLPSQIPFRNGAAPPIPPPPGPSAAPMPRRSTGDSDPGQGSSRSLLARGASASSASTVPPKSSPLAEKPAVTDRKPSAPIPRPNFFPKAGTSRPRSRSFSGFNTTEVSPPPRASREEGSAPIVNAPIKVGRSMSANLTAPSPPSASSPLSQGSSTSNSPPTTTTLGKHASQSSLRAAHAPSPLSLPQNNSVLGVRQPLRSPTSPLAVSPVATGGSPASASRSSHQLRPMGSRSNMNERPTLPRGTVSDSPSSSPVHTRNESLLSFRDRPSFEIDPSRVVSPSPGRDSLRSKLSLPNLRRNQSRASLSSVSQQENETVQVQDMDFELIRPNLAQLQGSGRSSEDSSLGREPSMDGRTSNVGEQRRTDSPAISIVSTQTPWSSSSETSIDAHRQRELKWVSLMGTVPPAQAKKSKKVKKLLMDGSVPSSVRFLVWSHLTDGKAKAIPGVYAQLGKRARVSTSADIERDVQRILVDHPHMQSNRPSLMAVLQAYLTMVPDVEYSRGLPLVAGHLLALSPEEDAFWIFVSMMDSYLRPYFSSNTTQIEVDAALFSRALEANDAQVAKKVLTDMGVNPVDICRPWFSTLFVDSLPLEYLNRVWDLFLFEGIPFLFRVGLALVYCCRQRILECSKREALFGLLNHPSPNWLPPSPDAFVALALSFKLKDDDVRKQRIKMEAQVKRQTQTPRANPAATRAMSLPRPAPS
ncbi:rab-GAP TBC domain-containing protein [Favolaschia claudopus]|uniref:Rab-GAP TBC domain-containing protein n=1 Tax=Favolaschia claudopus TaxID=2862362 RepID=A0AAW0C9T4_9AGAR